MTFIVGTVLLAVVTALACARQWTRTLPTMVALSAVIGAAGSGISAYASIALGRVPTGPLIVLTLFAVFLVSVLFAPRRSIVTRAGVRLTRAGARLARRGRRP